MKGTTIGIIAVILIVAAIIYTEFSGKKLLVSGPVQAVGGAPGAPGSLANHTNTLPPINGNGNTISSPIGNATGNAATITAQGNANAAMISAGAGAVADIFANMPSFNPGGDSDDDDDDE